MDYSTILFEKINNYAIVTLNRPDKLNALNKQMFDDLDDVITKVDNDSANRALIVTGCGDKAFAAGADIAELKGTDKSTGKYYSEYGSRILSRLEHLKIPVIAAVNGFALGGGCELAMACHIRFAADNAKLGLPELNLGIIPGYGGTQRLPRLVGKAVAMELILSGRFIDAAEALRIGLVNAVYPQDELMPRTLEFVSLVLTKAPLAVSATVAAVGASEDIALSEGLQFESELFGELCGSEDFREGTNAFLNKSKVEFKGR